MNLLKGLLPNHPILLPVLSGPFRGARIRMNPRHSLRKVFGLYEHELNSWLTKVLPRVTNVLDVGANDGYFTLGSAASFQRRRQNGTVIAFEPLTGHVRELAKTLEERPYESVKVSLRQCLVGKRSQPGIITLNDVEHVAGSTLLKIDVEGAEIDVLEGASSWLKPTNFFLIEVHKDEYLPQIQARFASVGITLQQVNQVPLRYFGKESREDNNWWLVSKLD